MRSSHSANRSSTSEQVLPSDISNFGKKRQHISANRSSTSEQVLPSDSDSDDSDPGKKKQHISKEPSDSDGTNDNSSSSSSPDPDSESESEEDPDVHPNPDGSGNNTEGNIPDTENTMATSDATRENSSETSMAMRENSSETSMAITPAGTSAATTVSEQTKDSCHTVNEDTDDLTKTATSTHNQGDVTFTDNMPPFSENQSPPSLELDLLRNFFLSQKIFPSLRSLTAAANCSSVPNESNDCWLISALHAISSILPYHDPTMKIFEDYSKTDEDGDIKALKDLYPKPTKSKGSVQWKEDYIQSLHSYIFQCSDARKKLVSCLKIFFDYSTGGKKAAKNAPKYLKTAFDLIKIWYLATTFDDLTSQNKGHASCCKEWELPQDIFEFFQKFFHRTVGICPQEDDTFCLQKENNRMEDSGSPIAFANYFSVKSTSSRLTDVLKCSPDTSFSSGKILFLTNLSQEQKLSAYLARHLEISHESFFDVIETPLELSGPLANHRYKLLCVIQQKPDEESHTHFTSICKRLNTKSQLDEYVEFDNAEVQPFFGPFSLANIRHIIYVRQEPT